MMRYKGRFSDGVDFEIFLFQSDYANATAIMTIALIVLEDPATFSVSV